MRPRIFAAFVITAAVSGCAPGPPALPYLTIGEYAGECGFSWNDAAIRLDMLPRLAEEWEGSTDVLMVFRFDPVPAACVAQAEQAYRSLGFRRVYVVGMAKPEPGDPPLLPPRSAGKVWG
ncbi:hypothetical protein [Aurantiacibacter luteus]|uniref:Lipoprotein n=1 Tax=Aurantiacibacter luteus TaxID=1581420 RepID=A0A0G9MV66_9SPHN|nr:hypothetical protein [Aurantiacibacter luteus]KLE34484.1 hypothetical protein AAW00_09705 [Aurantiacibacter luteus]